MRLMSSCHFSNSLTYDTSITLQFAYTGIKIHLSLNCKKKKKKKEEGIKNNTVNVMFFKHQHCTSIVPKTTSAIAPSDLNTWNWKSSPQKLEKAASHDIWINVRFISLYQSDFTVYVLGCWGSCHWWMESSICVCFTSTVLCKSLKPRLIYLYIAF